ncbi:Hypothetical predicted protein [Podarcis lilfordi]|uniref:Uncharacterized protein n=1 Tax=Podarcis lilfordi TaxID=74358 RepID=A0AA35KTC0_9SAUR|nr:Hypothetical predicted protein [Podarcis lilfordi]
MFDIISHLLYFLHTFSLLKSKGKCVCVLWSECRLHSYPRSQNSKRDCCSHCAAIPLAVLASEIQNIFFLVFLLQKLGESCGLVRLNRAKNTVNNGEMACANAAF